MRHLLAAAAASIAAVTIAPNVQAQSITPATVNATLNLGASITIHKTITLGAGGSTLVDLFFLADNTGSMGSIINNAKTGASSILGGLPGGVSYNFGVGAYFGDPFEGVPPASSYVVNDPLGPSSAAAQTGINAWIASGGGDTPEGNFFALRQVANTTAWRSGSQRLIVWFGDAPGHQETVTTAQAIAALQAAGATVIAFNSGAGGTGMDQGGEATAVATATGGSETNNFLSLTPAQFNAKVNAEISTAITNLNLVFGSSLASSGLSLLFTCTDVLGCNNVPGGASRTFDLKITANTVGTYDFSVFANGVAATELDHIVVVGSTVTPEPTTMVFMATGLLGLGAFSRRRRKTTI